ncbi:TauD/TfdA family dioxygenase [Streptomyces sp. FH025]|uniref:TauD/TfdA family dioxygenase n=1 Tax=Streptomyces sp. FH025 TaxID=2815937 RepID=UPI001A9D59CB|nr:TauD/TfdA family dioxygenase [Streptomyces sp. FH025]MBO1413065.1 TauD/TfdA family dioxygenase [Streptomyces sp. FH025]
MLVTEIPGALPAVIEADGGTTVPELIAAERDRIRELITESGAVLFRGFKEGGVDNLDASVRALSGAPLHYSERSSPRTNIKGQVYTSTEYPNTEEIFLHNECSYQLSWPGLVYFTCLAEATEQGATPLADVRKVYQAIDPSVREEFERRGWMYVRNFLGQDMGGTWQYYYDTKDRAEVERYCAGQDIGVEWLGEDGLHTRAVRQAVHRHPVTGEKVWFNHATFFHVTTLPAEYSAGLREMYDEDELPSNTYYGDGGVIPDDVIAHLQQAYRSAWTRYDWRQGDLLVIDNMLTAHGREPFAGPRKIAIAMAEASNGAGSIARD